MILRALAALALLQPVLQAQQLPFAGWDRIVDERFHFDPDRSEVATYAIQNTSQVRVRFVRALDAMRAGDFKAACEPLQEIISQFPSGLYQVADGPARYVGAAEFAKYLLSAFPPEGRRDYAEWSQLRTEPLFRALVPRLDGASLARFAHEWELSPSGLKALALLGDLAFERGEFDLAARLYLRRLAFEEQPSSSVAEIAFKAALASAGSPDATDAVDQARALLAGYPAPELMLGGKPLSPAAALDAALADRPPRSAQWPLLGGDPTHARLPDVDESTLSFAASWSAPAFSRPELNPWRLLSGKKAFPFHAIVADDSLVVTDGLTIRAFSFFSDEPKWTYDGPLARPLDDDYLRFEHYRDTSAGSDMTLGSLARNLQLVASASRGVVVAPLIDARLRGPDIEFDQMRITPPIPRRSLHAVDARTGKLLWRQRRPELGEDAFVNKVSIVASPVIVGDRVIAAGYVLEGAINVHVLCLSLADGSLLWRTPLLVGQQELTMFNKAFKEFALQMAAESGGTVFVSTNLGLMVALDLFSGDPRWMTEYESIPIHGSVHYKRTTERQTNWNNDPPLVADGVVVAAPLDSEYFYGFDAATGQRLWREHYTQGHALDYVSLLGIDHGVLVMSGSRGLGFHDLGTGRSIGSYRYRQVKPWSGRGCVSKGVVWQPQKDGLLRVGFTAQGGGVATDERLLEWGGAKDPGNALIWRDFLVMLSSERLTVFYDIDSLVARARASVNVAEPAVESLLRLGELEQLRRDFDAAAACFGKVAGAASASPDEVKRARAGLFRCHRELAEQAHGAGDERGTVDHLMLAADAAPDDVAFLETAEKLLAIFQRSEPARYEKVLDWIDERCPDVLYPFQSDLLAADGFEGPIPAQLFTLDRRSVLALAHSDPAGAVANWQKMIERHRALEQDGLEVKDFAAAKIAAAIERYGRDVYAPIDRRVAELHARALAEGDAGTLERLIDEHPNAASLDSMRLDLAGLRVAAGDPGAAFAALSPLMNAGAKDADAALRLRALEQAAAAADLAGDAPLARALRDRVAGGGQAVPAPAPAQDPHLLDAMPMIEPKVFALHEDARAFLLELDGEPFPEGQTCALLYEETHGIGSSQGWLRLIDVGAMKERWRQPVDTYFNDNDTMVGHLVGGRLLVRQRNRLRAFDAATGAVLYDRALDRAAGAECFWSGLLYLTEAGVESGYSIIAIEPATGSVFWRHESRYNVVDLLPAGASLLAVSSRDASVEALDALTGETRFRLSELQFSNAFEVKAVPEFGLLLVVGHEGATRKKIGGFDLFDGRSLWTLENVRQVTIADWLLVARDKLVLIEAGQKSPTRSARGILGYKLIEPRTGVVAQSLALQESPRSFDRGPTALGDRLVCLTESRNGGTKQCDELVSVALGQAAFEHRTPLRDLPASGVTYRAVGTRDGRTFCIVDHRPSQKQTQSFALAFDPATGSVEIGRFSADEYRALTQVQAVRGALVALRDDRLYVFSMRPLR